MGECAQLERFQNIGLMSSLTLLKVVKLAKKVLRCARLGAAKTAKTRHVGMHSTGTVPKYRPNGFPDLAKGW